MRPITSPSERKCPGPPHSEKLRRMVAGAGQRKLAERDPGNGRFDARKERLTATGGPRYGPRDRNSPRRVLIAGGAGVLRRADCATPDAARPRRVPANGLSAKGAPPWRSGTRSHGGSLRRRAPSRRKPASSAGFWACGNDAKCRDACPAAAQAVAETQRLVADSKSRKPPPRGRRPRISGPLPSPERRQAALGRRGVQGTSRTRWWARHHAERRAADHPGDDCTARSASTASCCLRLGRRASSRCVCRFGFGADAEQIVHKGRLDPRSTVARDLFYAAAVMGRRPVHPGMSNRNKVKTARSGPGISDRPSALAAMVVAADRRSQSAPWG